MDLSGNLWEWVQAADGQPVLRGGGRHFSAGLGRCRSRAEAATDFSVEEAGVRCCYRPQ